MIVFEVDPEGVVNARDDADEYPPRLIGFITAQYQTVGTDAVLVRHVAIMGDRAGNRLTQDFSDLGAAEIWIETTYHRQYPERQESYEPDDGE